MSRIMGLSPTIKLGDGVEMPRVGLGTFRSRGEDVQGAVEHALNANIRHIDTASIYKNETDIGEALRKSGVKREEIFLTSKISPYEMGTEKSTAALNDILQRLGTNYLDLLLIHWPGAAKTKPDDSKNQRARVETYRVMEQAHRHGKVRALGVSNFTVPHLQDLLTWCEVRPVVNQVEHELREFCAKEGIAVTAYASFGQGALLSEPTVKGLAGRRGIAEAQLLLLWGLEKGLCVIPKSVQPERIALFNPDILLSLPALTEEEEQVLEKLLEEKGETKFCWDPKQFL